MKLASPLKYIRQTLLWVRPGEKVGEIYRGNDILFDRQVLHTIVGSGEYEINNTKYLSSWSLHCNWVRQPQATR
jgi:hypothetical protein